MTPDEITIIETQSFDEMWNNFCPDTDITDSKKQFYKNKEYTDSKEKYNALKYKIDVELGLDFYVKNVKPFYNTPEWSYPKGRKNKGETDMDCAIREFCEETNYNVSDIKLFPNVKPFIENITGTNGVNYRHIYYLAKDISNNVPIIDERNCSEIGDIGYFTYEETIQMFRKYHIEKKSIARNAFLYYLDTLLNKTKSQNEVSIWSTDNDIF